MMFNDELVRMIEGLPFMIAASGNIYGPSGKLLTRNGPKGCKSVKYGPKPNTKAVYCHRLVALAWIPNPDNLPMVDHINGERSDNRVENLRWVTNRENTQNRIEHRKGSLPGTTRYPKGWRAQARINGKKVNLGMYPTMEEAHARYVDAISALQD